MGRLLWFLLLSSVAGCSGGSSSTPSVPTETVAEQPEHAICGARTPEVCFSEERKTFTAYNDWNRLAPIYEYACLGGVHEACAAYGEFWYAYDRDTRGTPVLQQVAVACEAGNAKACLYSAMSLPNRDPLLDRSCELGEGMACGMRGALHELRDPSAARPYYERGCTLQDGSSCAALARITDDPKQKAELEQRACEYEVSMCKDPDSAAFMDECHERGFGCFGLLFLAGVEEEQQAVMGTLERACQRQPSLCTVLGEVHTSNRVAGADRDKAIEYFRRACFSDERYVLNFVDSGCQQWVELTCIEDMVCTEETLDAIVQLDDFYRLPYEAAFHCQVGDDEAAAEAIAACDCGLVCEDQRIYQEE